MDNTDRHFKGQHQNEEIRCFCRKHWVVLVPEFIGLAIFMTVIAIIAFNLNLKVISFLRGQKELLAFFLILGAGLVTFYIHHFFIRLINHFLDIVIITNYRIVTLRKTLYIHHDRDAIDISKTQDVIKKQNGLIKNLLSYGEILITLSGASITKVLPYIPNPDYHFRKIYEVKREYIVKRAMEKREMERLGHPQAPETAEK